MNFASGTSVPTFKTEADIKMLLQKAGATRINVDQQDGCAALLFELRQWKVLFELELPSQSLFSHRDVRGVRKPNTTEQAAKLWEQACRERWRALLLTIKAKLVSVDTGIEPFEHAFLAQIVVPGQARAERFGMWASRLLAQVYTTGSKLPQLTAG